MNKGHMSDASYTNLFITDDLKEEFAVAVYIMKRDKLAEFLKMITAQTPCGRVFECIITGMTSPVDGNDALVIDRIETDKNTHDRIDELCAKCGGMASVTVERFDEGKLMTLFLFALI